METRKSQGIYGKCIEILIGKPQGLYSMHVTHNCLINVSVVYLIWLS
jgi:hypothetical protein